MLSLTPNPYMVRPQVRNFIRRAIGGDFGSGGKNRGVSHPYKILKFPYGFLHPYKILIFPYEFLSTLR